MLIFKAILVVILISTISFLGSLQAGLVNLSVIKTALTRGQKAALQIALGGCLPELLYAGLAVWAGDFVSRYASLGRYMDCGVVVVFLAMGIAMIYHKPKPLAISTETNGKGKGEFWKGVVLGLINPQLFPFWLGVYVYTNRTLFSLQTPLLQLCFVCGAALGAWVLLALLARYVAKNQHYILRWLGHRLFMLVLGWLFVGLAVWKIIFILI